MRPDARPAGARDPLVARLDRVEAFGEQRSAAASDAVEVGHGGREREAALAVPHVAVVEHRQERAAWRVGVGVDGRPGLRADGHERHAWRAAEALLGARPRAGPAATPRTRSSTPPSEDTTSTIVTTPRARQMGPIRVDRVERARRRLGVDHREHLDVGVRVEIGRHGVGVDGLVVGHLELVELGADGAQPVAEALAEHARHEVEHGRAAGAQRPRGGLEAEHRLALHQDHLVAGGPEDPRASLARCPGSARGTPGRSGTGWVRRVAARTSG